MKFNFMPFKVLFGLTVLILLFGCAASHEGLWVGTYYGEQTYLMISDSTGVLSIGRYSNGGTVNMSGNTGVFFDGYNSMDINLSGNTLTLSEENDTIITFTKSTAADAHSQIRGRWNGPRGWTLFFIKDKVYLIDDDGDFDFGDFTYAPNSGGLFLTDGWGYNMSFSVSGNALNAQVSSFFGNESLSFTKAR